MSHRQDNTKHSVRARRSRNGDFEHGNASSDTGMGQGIPQKRSGRSQKSNVSQSLRHHAGGRHTSHNRRVRPVRRSKRIFQVRQKHKKSTVLQSENGAFVLQMICGQSVLHAEAAIRRSISISLICAGSWSQPVLLCTNNINRSYPDYIPPVISHRTGQSTSDPAFEQQQQQPVWTILRIGLHRCQSSGYTP